MSKEVKTDKELDMMPDWGWLTDTLAKFDITEKGSDSKNVQGFNSLEARLYREIQNRYNRRKKPDYINTEHGKTSKQYEDAQRIHSDQIKTMHAMGYGLMLDGYTFYKYGHELEPYDFETNFNMNQAYEIHSHLLADRKKYQQEIAEAKDSAFAEVAPAVIKAESEASLLAYRAVNHRIKMGQDVERFVNERLAWYRERVRRSIPNPKRTGGRAMTDNTQGLDEMLLEYRGRILTYDELYRKQHHSSRRRIVDFEHANTVIKQALFDWHNKQIEEVLDRLAIEVRASDYIGIAETIQSERNKLKESK